ncbi:hypothetical protein NC653_036808 [Populus alba x Populus x berolinensis]|uniref:Uncharacterized protein n=1 Tax=Populus alba x Populus x berolinensis TaxID=444605 RepID=A0AAD6PV46_9ROSI|nr:hypothetical protein NC653_036808 [Populus alba x Populus x berolinensis]
MKEYSFLPRAACYSFCHTSCRCQNQIQEEGVRTGCSPAITSDALLLDILINTNKDLVNLMHICCFCSTISNEAYIVLFGRKNTESKHSNTVFQLHKHYHIKKTTAYSSMQQTLTASNKSKIKQC